MQEQMLLKDFYNTLNIWKDALEQYPFEMLCSKPSLKSWSLGQVYMHLFSETSHYLEQAIICFQTAADPSEEMTAAGKMMYANNEFPDELIEGPPENALVQQPNHKQELVEKFHHLKLMMRAIENLLASNSAGSIGKTKHPGLGYFTAVEWMQFADMHLRHHLKQKNRIDKWLQRDNLGM